MAAKKRKLSAGLAAYNAARKAGKTPKKKAVARSRFATRKAKRTSTKGAFVVKKKKGKLSAGLMAYMAKKKAGKAHDAPAEKKKKKTKTASPHKTRSNLGSTSTKSSNRPTY